MLVVTFSKVYYQDYDHFRMNDYKIHASTIRIFFYFRRKIITLRYLSMTLNVI